LGVERLVHAIPLAPEFHRDLGIAYKEKASLTPAARRFIDQIAKSSVARDLPPAAAASLTPCL
ncbi:MAG: LysR family transcriptional regulator, partial [Selenomonas bovis]|nr:LysR family transcriptional regulator [Selenomonas bovis]